jgi:phosphoribosylformylglycinamidine (FGAM) synthase-like enzyme
VPREGVGRDDTLLFSESQSRFVVTVRPEAKAAFEKLLKGSVFAEIGTVLVQDIFEVKGLEGKVIIKEKIANLKEAWQKPLNF